MFIVYTALHPHYNITERDNRLRRFTDIHLSPVLKRFVFRTSNNISLIIPTKGITNFNKSLCPYPFVSNSEKPSVQLGSNKRPLWPLQYCWCVLQNNCQYLCDLVNWKSDFARTTSGGQFLNKRKICFPPVDHRIFWIRVKTAFGKTLYNILPWV